jgi:hypothetical protein
VSMKLSGYVGQESRYGLIYFSLFIFNFFFMELAVFSAAIMEWYDSLVLGSQGQVIYYSHVLRRLMY